MRIKINKAKIFLITILVLFFISNIEGQETYQIFTTAGFKVNCGCELYVNTTFIKMAEQQGTKDIIASYVCAENEDNPDIAVIYNINIYDVSKSYNNVKSSDFGLFEKAFLEQYSSNLKNLGGINYYYTNYMGVSAIEYTFNQMGVSTKAITFLKNKKSYLIQVGTRKNLTSKFNTFKSSFVLL